MFPALILVGCVQAREERVGAFVLAGNPVAVECVREHCPAMWKIAVMCCLWLFCEIRVPGVCFQAVRADSGRLSGGVLCASCKGGRGLRGCPIGSAPEGGRTCRGSPFTEKAAYGCP